MNNQFKSHVQVIDHGSTDKNNEERDYLQVIRQDNEE